MISKLYFIIYSILYFIFYILFNLRYCIKIMIYIIIYNMNSNTNNINKVIKSKKNLSKYVRNTNNYKFKQVDDYNKLTPFTYTILLKDTTIKTKRGSKKETQIRLKRGDYVVCGPKKEKYGLALKKVLYTYDLGDLTNKEVVREGFELDKTIMKNKKKIDIVPSWGGKQTLELGDHIMYELNKKNGYYGVDRKAFKKTYKVKSKK